MQTAPLFGVRVIVAVVAIGACATTPTVTPPVPPRPAPTCSAPTWGPLTDEPRTLGESGDATRELPDLRIAEVSIVGAPDDVSMLATSRGNRLRDAPIDADVRRLWALRAFSDVRVDVTARADGAHVAFVATPRPRIDRVVVGDAPELGRLRALVGSAFEPVRIRRMADAIKDASITDGYLDAQITVRRATARPGVALCVDADLGTRWHIGRLTYTGRSKLAVTEIAGKLHTGDVANREQLEAEPLYVLASYWDHGMARAKVHGPIEVRRGDRIDLEFQIEEGEPYRFGEIKLEDGSALTLPSTIAPGELYSQTKISNVREALTTQLHDDHAYVVPTTKRDDVTHTIAITFEVRK